MIAAVRADDGPPPIRWSRPVGVGAKTPSFSTAPSTLAPAVASTLAPAAAIPAAKARRAARARSVAKTRSSSRNRAGTPGKGKARWTGRAIAVIDRALSDDMPDKTPHSGRLQFICLLLVASTVTWRAGTYYSGGIDPVVASKAALSVMALWMALSSARHARPAYPRGNVALWLVFITLVLSAVGSYTTSSSVTASLTLTARLAIVAGAAFGLVRAYPAAEVIRALIKSMALIVIVSVAPALFLSTWSGRLTGYIPPLNPNEITELSGFVILALSWRIAQRRRRRSDVVVLVVFMLIVYLTGSRTGLVALLMALVVVLLQSRKLPLSAVLALLRAVPAGFYVIFGSGLVSGFLGRGGATGVATLSQRTIAWTAALHLHHNVWEVWFGNGLAKLEIPVVAQYRTQQILDSSWVSALVQGGIVGLVLLAVWVLYGIRVAFRAPRPYRMLATSLLLFIVFRSFLESGLIAATPAFLLFFVISVTAGRPSRPMSPIEAAVVPERRLALADR